MVTDFIQRQIQRLLSQAEEALDRGDWAAVKEAGNKLVALDPGNRDASALLAAAERVSSSAPPDTLLARDVAFALIKTEGLDEQARARITREAQAMGRLGDHPHIVTVYDIGQEEGQPYLVLPLLPGGDVGDLIEKAENHQLALELAIRIADQLCQALDHAHGKGIIHRDVKPGNVWLTQDGTAKLGARGLAVAIDRSRLTQAGLMGGTVSYMPPEQAMGGT